MKKLILLQALFILTFSNVPLSGMMTKFTTKLKNTVQKTQWAVQEEIYKPSVFLTNSVMFLGSNIAYGYYKLTKKSTCHKESIKNQLAIIKKDLEEDKINIIKDLVKDYNIPNEQQEQLALRIKKYKNFSTKWMSQQRFISQFTKYHDKDFPLLDALPLLEKNNIDPDTIWLIQSQSPHEKDEEQETVTAGTAKSLSFKKYQYPNSESDYYYLAGDIDSPPNITLYSSALNETILKKATLIHEIGHITEHHGLERSIIAELIHRLTKTKHQDIYSNKNYKRLKQQHEREAEILPALQDKNDASILRKKRQSTYYPQKLYGEHYLTLAFIDTLHKLDSKLSE